ncbi:MAG: hypothetical protein IPO42_03755 [Chitinophagaceae bacterium]|nr:hypothetical protein [Chitinophagaceae bacterium]MBK9530913.1 hypothetical protein [Chitinophagaceae bacterium]
METKQTLMEPLLESAEAYGRTSMDVIKLKVVDKSAAVTTSMVTYSLFTIIVSLVVFTLNIAIALWLGELMGKTYYGFLVIAACYALAGVILLLIQPFIKSRVSNAVIRQLLN